ncbi:hypothetical protein DPX16_23590 [Anabarilius grahami]|uniref:Uncharacterized protein n=1 Tax=Anabarilius grahami TaxID=495550 RepID=A0A3N0XSD6_ANAGA|nr:hypothetical protein DPX16_23590 [Anabarilius grahami]
MHDEEESLIGQRLSKDHSWRIAEKPIRGQIPLRGVRAQCLRDLFDDQISPPPTDRCKKRASPLGLLRQQRRHSHPKPINKMVDLRTEEVEGGLGEKDL